MVETNAPYDQAFQRANGPHLVLTFDPRRVKEARLRRTASAGPVTEAAGPWPALQTNYQPLQVWLSVDTTMTLCTIGGGGGGGGAVTLGPGSVQPGAFLSGALSSTVTNGQTATGVTVVGTDVGGVSQPNSSTNPFFVNGGVIQATLTPSLQQSTATVLQIVAAPVSPIATHITGWGCYVDSAAASAGTCQLVQGTGTNCATSQIPLTFQYSFSANSGAYWGGGLGNYKIATAGDAVCAKFTTSNLTTIDVQATQF